MEYKELLILMLFIGTAWSLTRPTSIKFENNAYTGIVVGIHPDTEESDALIDKIKSVITDASEYLYRATRKRAYFQNVTIVIPDTWTDRGYDPPGNDSYETADVVVAPPNPRWAPNPYTKQYAACGNRAAHIHLIDEFLLYPDIELYFGPLGPLFIHEWGHFRWGLMDEYANANEDRSHYQPFYQSPTTGNFEATRCTYDFSGSPLKIDTNTWQYLPCNGNETIGYEDGCIWLAEPNQPDSSGSIMFGYTNIPEIVDFCDNDTSDPKTLHNPEAPNKQNRFCDGRSSWEIMRDHADFRDGANPPANISDTTPTFHIVRTVPKKVVFVLDRSGSMQNFNRYNRLISAVYHYILTVVREGSSVGIVSFSTVSNVDSPLVLINSSQARDWLINSIDVNEPVGGTCIECGLLAAIQLLRGESDGSTIILISDGEETTGDLTRAISPIVNLNIIVDSIAISNKAEEKLQLLCDLSGGKFYLQTDDPGSVGLYLGLAATMQKGVKESEQRISLRSTSSFLNPYEFDDGNIAVDNTIGRATRFDFNWLNNGDDINIFVNLTSPSGVMYTRNSSEYQEDLQFRFVSFQIPGDAEVGIWNFSVFYTYEYFGDEVILDVSTYPLESVEDPIIVTSELSGSSADVANGENLIAYAEVRQGYNPILDAYVVAVIERPGDHPVEIELLDNGAGADIKEADGIYSRFFTDYSETGFYGFSIRVDNNNGKAIILRPSSLESFASARVVIDPTNELLKNGPPVIAGVELRLPGMAPPELEGDPAPNFIREAGGQSATVPELPPDYDPLVDTTAPGKIQDLRVQNTSYDDATVTLEWTATGDDLDKGAASYYEIRRARSIVELTQNFNQAILVNQSEIIRGNLTAPQTFGQTEVFVISVPNNTKSSYSWSFALLAVDDVGLQSGVSNKVQATLRSIIVPTSAPITTKKLTTEPESTESSTEAEPQTPSPQEGLDVWAIILIVIAGVFVCGGGFAVAAFIVTKKSKSKKSKQNKVTTVDVETAKVNPTYERDT